MNGNVKSTQFWYTVVVVVAATAALVAGKIDGSQWATAVAAATAGLGLRKALEHLPLK